MIYSGYLLGQRINAVSPEAEAWFWRINVTCDDWGNRIAEPALMRDVCGRREYTLEHIDALTKELEASNLLKFYKVNGDRYLHVVDYEEWQAPDKKGRRVSRCPRYQDVERGGESGKSGVVSGSSGDSGGDVAHTPLILMPKPMPKPILKNILKPSPKPTLEEKLGGQGLEVSSDGKGLRAGWGGLAGLERLIGAKLLEGLTWWDNKERLHPKTLVKLKSSPYCTGERVWWLSRRVKDGEAEEPAKFLATAILDEWDVPSNVVEEYEEWRSTNCKSALAQAMLEDEKAQTPV